jgi:hypothetical protein
MYLALLSLPSHLFQPLSVAMSPTADTWISDFVDLLSPNGTTSSLTTSGHTGGSFTAVGQHMEGIGLVDGEYKGGAEHARLFLFDATRLENCSLCLGFVGSG